MEALESENAGVDIILSDVELPQEKCFKMLQHIVRQENLSHIAVVVMSERDDMAVVANCLRLGALDYLVKPLRLNEVMNLWTHMWRRRRTLGLPNKHALHGSINFPKSDSTTDFLSGKEDKKCSIPSTDTGPAIDSRAEIPLQLELSLRLSSNYNAEKLPRQALDSAPMHSSLQEKVRHSSAFAAYSKTSNQQPSELSANVCAPGSPSPTWLEKMNETSLIKFRASMLRALTTSDDFHESTKDFAMTDENRSVNMESQICDAPCQDVSPVQSSNAVAERVFHARQVPATHVQGHQQCHKMVESPGVDMQQGFTANVQEIYATSLKQGDFSNPTTGSPQVMQKLPYHCEAGMVNFPSIPNVYSYYPLAHVAMPQFMSFSTWPSMMTAAPVVGGKIIQAERREAALYKFRMKRKGRCFEKKIRYVSRKKLAEQRPRVRGQFVRRTVTMESSESPAIGNGYVDEEGEADDEQGCSELDNNSSPDFMAESCRVG